MGREHCIRKFLLDISYNKEEGAFSLQNRISVLAKEKLKGISGEVLSHFGSENEIIKFQKLELDLGDFYADEGLETAVSSAFREKLRDVLLIRTGTEISEGDKQDFEVIPVYMGPLLTLKEFLASGMIPWSESTSFKGVSMADIIKEALRSQPNEVEMIFAKATENPSSLLRIIRQLPEEIIEDVISGFGVKNVSFLAQELADILSFPGNNASAMKLRETIWKFLLTSAIADAEIRIEKALEYFSSELHVPEEAIFRIIRTRVSDSGSLLLREWGWTDQIRKYADRHGYLLVPEDDIPAGSVFAIENWFEKNAPKIASFIKEVLATVFSLKVQETASFSDKEHLEKLVWSRASGLLTNSIITGKASFKAALLSELSQRLRIPLSKISTEASISEKGRKKVDSYLDVYYQEADKLEEKVSFLKAFLSGHEGKKSTEKAERLLRELIENAPAVLYKILYGKTSSELYTKGISESLVVYLKELTESIQETGLFSEESREVIRSIDKDPLLGYTRNQSLLLSFFKAGALSGKELERVSELIKRESPLLVRKIMAESGFDPGMYSAQKAVLSLDESSRDILLRKVFHTSPEKFEKQQQETAVAIVERFWQKGLLPLSLTINRENFVEAFYGWYRRFPEYIKEVSGESLGKGVPVLRTLLSDSVIVRLLFPERIPEGNARHILDYLLQEVKGSKENEKWPEVKARLTDKSPEGIQPLGPDTSMPDTEEEATENDYSADYYLNLIDEQLEKNNSSNISDHIRLFAVKYKAVSLKYFSALPENKYRKTEAFLPASLKKLVWKDRKLMGTTDDREQQAEERTPVITDPVYIKNAGMVILHPFLPRFFKILELVEEGKFKGDYAAHKGAHLLQYLANKGLKTEEHEMILNKLFCGVPLESPLIRDVDISDKEKEVCDDLLKGVIQHWAALKKTSPDNLRGSFLLREGRLEEKDKGWRLRVEERGYDILVERLPWSVAMVRLPWMERILHVEWR